MVLREPVLNNEAPRSMCLLVCVLGLDTPGVRRINSKDGKTRKSQNEDTSYRDGVVYDWRWGSAHRR